MTKGIHEREAVAAASRSSGEDSNVNAADALDSRRTRRRGQETPPSSPQSAPPPLFRCLWCLAPSPALYYYRRCASGGGAGGGNDKALSSHVVLASCARCGDPAVDPYCEREDLLVLLDLILLRPHAYRHALLNRRRAGGNDGKGTQASDGGRVRCATSSSFDSSRTGLVGAAVLCGLLEAFALWDANELGGGVSLEGPLLLVRFGVVWVSLVLAGITFVAGAWAAAAATLGWPLLPPSILGWALIVPALGLHGAALLLAVWEPAGGRTVAGALGSLLSLAYRAAAVLALVDAHDADPHHGNVSKLARKAPSATTRWWKAAAILIGATACRTGAVRLLSAAAPRVLAAAGSAVPDAASPIQLCTGLSVSELLPSAFPAVAGGRDLCLA